MDSSAKYMFALCSILFLATFVEVVDGKKKPGPPAISPEESQAMALKAVGLKGGGKSSPLPKCLGENLKIAPITTAATECGKEMKGDVRGEKSACFVACMWKKLELIDSNMMFSKDISTFISSVFPKASQQTVKDAISRCEKASPGPLSMEDNCSNFKPMQKCIMKAVLTACK